MGLLRPTWTAPMLPLLLCGACTPRSLPPLVVDAVEPASAPLGRTTALEIRGKFAVAVRADFARGHLEIDPVFRLELGATALESVTYVDEGTLRAVVPPTLGRGDYDLRVVDPRGRQARLTGAFVVFSPDDTDGGDDDGGPPADGGDAGADAADHQPQADGGDAVVPDEDGDPRPSDDGDTAPADGDALGPGGDDAPELCSATCTCNGGQCLIDCPTGACDLECSNAATCSLSCPQTCQLSCVSDSHCTAQCGTGCTFDTARDTWLDVSCGSACTILWCATNAQCTLRCVDSSECTLGCAASDLIDCGGGVQTCRAPCP